MKTAIVSLICSVTLTGTVFGSAFIESDTTRNIFEKGLDQLKLQKARHLFMSNDPEGALSVYESLTESNARNALLHYRIGECKFAVSSYDESVQYFKKAAELSDEAHKELHFNYGRALHRQGELDDALEHLEKYKNSLKPSQKYETSEVHRMIKQVGTAKQLITNPVDVKIKNAGDRINTRYDEHGPTVSTDGKLLVFTARRPDTKGALKDPADGKYLEDLYVSTWHEKGYWNKSEPIKGRLNTEDHDGALGLTPDGQEIFVYRNEGEAGNGAGDIYVARLSSSGKWGSAKDLGKTVNTTYFESSASMTADKKKLYFISERKGGFGQADIYVVERISKTEWGEAMNLGPVINTPWDERMVFVSPDGMTLFISSNGLNTMGGHDIFRSTYVNGAWSKPENLGFPINTVNDEVNFTVTSDGKKAFSSGYKSTGFGGSDIYEIDLSNYELITPAPEVAIIRSVLKGTISDAEKGKVEGCTIELLEHATNNKISETKTDANGQYQFEVTSEKTYRFIVKKDGFITTESTEIEVNQPVIVKNMILKK